MRKIKVLLTAILLIALTAVSVNAQTEGSVFNPYSQYGFGNLSTLGTASSKGMGGVGIATRERFEMSLSNPASYNSSDRQNVIFSASGTGINNYLKSDEISNSRNYFNLGHLSAQLRLSKTFGFGIVLAPFSDMGYEMSRTLTQNDVVTNIGNVRYDFLGSGGIAQVKAGFAATIFKNFNLGINYVYYVGSFDQSFNTVYTPYIDAVNYKNTYGYSTQKVNQSSVELGFQYRIKLGDFKWLNLGGIYQPEIKSAMDRTSILATGYSTSALTESDILEELDYEENFYMPTKIGFGINFVTNKISASIDYSLQQWSKAFPNNSIANISYQDRNEIRVGAQYIPNRFDIRSFLKRWSYRAGFTYADSYVVVDGNKTSEISGTLGLGIPIEKDWFSQLAVAVEVGQSGTLNNNLVRNTFVKLNIGITFATRRWFVRYKYH